LRLLALLCFFSSSSRAFSSFSLRLRNLVRVDLRLLALPFLFATSLLLLFFVARLHFSRLHLRLLESVDRRGSSDRRRSLEVVVCGMHDRHATPRLSPTPRHLPLKAAYLKIFFKPLPERHTPTTRQYANLKTSLKTLPGRRTPTKITQPLTVEHSGSHQRVHPRRDGLCIVVAQVDDSPLRGSKVVSKKVQ
jgi:hypothetical protein